MRHYVWGIVFLVFALLVVGVYSHRGGKSSDISSFDECVAAGYPVGESYPRQCWTPDGKHFVEMVTDGPFPPVGPITITGKMTCLPKVGNGPQTMECAFGLLADNGYYYALRYPQGLDPDYQFSQTDLRVEVEGTLLSEMPSGPDGNRYDVAGAIEVRRIQDISEK